MTSTGPPERDGSPGRHRVGTSSRPTRSPGPVFAPPRGVTPPSVRTGHHHTFPNSSPGNPNRLRRASPGRVEPDLVEKSVDVPRQSSENHLQNPSTGVEPDISGSGRAERLALSSNKRPTNWLDIIDGLDRSPGRTPPGRTSRTLDKVTRISGRFPGRLGSTDGRGARRIALDRSRPTSIEAFGRRTHEWSSADQSIQVTVRDLRLCLSVPRVLSRPQGRHGFNRSQPRHDFVVLGLTFTPLLEALPYAPPSLAGLTGLGR